MWLIDCKTRRLKHFLNEKVSGPYAILSHTWGDDEMTFDEFQLQDRPTKAGLWKIDKTCRQALTDGYSYCWVDTVCIDKRSSAELSEAINSMFKWYRNATVCYAHLEDVESISEIPDSRYFTRGWTLQELIAPQEVKFFNNNWSYLGDKRSLEGIIHQVTRIDVSVLQDVRTLTAMSVAKRMSWAALRTTSREEDQAYALLGLFDVAMPLLYGEGGEKAYRRLQEEIIRSSVAADHSILAWLSWSRSELETYGSLYDWLQWAYMGGFLSPWPFGFRHAQQITSWPSLHPALFELSHQGLRISLPCIKNGSSVSESGVTWEPLDVALNCRYEDNPRTQITLSLLPRREIPILGKTTWTTDGDAICQRAVHLRRSDSRLYCQPAWVVGSWVRLTCILARGVHPAQRPGLDVHITFPEGRDFEVTSVPSGAWHRQSRTLTLAPSRVHNQAPRAAIFARHIAIIIEHPHAFDFGGVDKHSLRIGAIPRSLFNSLYDDSIDMETVPVWTRRSLFVTEQATLEVNVKCASAAGELLWHLHLCEWPQ
jgi:hypothetical protein